MKILFDNLLESATISALYASPNYPVDNLQHAFLTKRFQAIVNTDTITIEWDDDQTIDCVFAEYTNADDFELRLYDSANSLLDTITFDSADGAQHFAPVSGVRSAQLDLSNSLSSIYLGGLGIGAAFEMPDPINDWKDGLIDNSTIFRPDGGQVLANRISMLREIPFNFRVYSYAEYSAIKDLVATVGAGKPIYLDPFEDAHDAMLSMYGTLSGGWGNPSKSDHEFAFTLTFTEAR